MTLRPHEAGFPQRSSVAQTSRAPYLPVIVLAILSVIVIARFVSVYTTLGPYDEFQHLDYAEKISRGEFVQVGDRVGDVAMREEACRGIDWPHFQGPSCDSADLRPEMFQEDGFNTAAAHPPLYYLVTGTFARALNALPGIDSFLVGARLAGMFWLVAGIAVFQILLRDRGVPPSLRFSLCLIVICTPPILYFVATVNNDGASLLVGSTVLLFGLRRLEGRAPLRWLCLACAGAMAMKYTFVLVVLLVLLLLLQRGLSASRAHGVRREHFRDVFWCLLATGLPVVGWQLVSGAAAKVSPDAIPMNRKFQVDHVPWSAVLEHALSGFPPTQWAYVPSLFATAGVTVWGSLGGWLVLSGPTVAGFGRNAHRTTRSLGTSTLVLFATMSTLFAIAFYIQGGIYFDVPSRYGLVLVPAALACTATMFFRAAGRWMVHACACIGAVVVTVSLF